jgi:cyanobactin maturation PatA/PatG family protease
MLAQPEGQFSRVRNALVSAGRGLASVKIGVADGLPDLCHPALQRAHIDVLATMIPPGTALADPHGTGVCGLIFGDRYPINGLAAGCSGLILPLFLRRTGDGQPRPVSQIDLARAIAFGLEHGVSIFNISAGQKSATDEAEAHLEQALQSCSDRRVLVVAAAGNEGCACIHLPAAVETVLPVGALNVAGQPLDSSNWGEAYRLNGLLAPGENLQVALPGGGVSTGTGTSFATAIVSAVAALLLSVARREGYRLDPLDIRQILIDSATPCDLEGAGACDRYLAGTLDAGAALAAVHSAGTSNVSIAPLQTVARETALAENNSQLQHAHTRRRMGSVAMSAEMSNANLGDAGAIAPTGVVASACTCEKQEVDSETEQSCQSAAAPIVTPPAPNGAQSIKQQACSCGKSEGTCSCGASQTPQLVFALGALWFDFGAEARYDAIVQQIGDPVRANNPSELFTFLRGRQEFLTGLTFILMQDQIPLYAIQPAGPFALQTYNAMLEAVEASLDDVANREQRVSIAGVIGGSTRLLNGMTVPVVYPDLRGMYRWQSRELIAAAKAAVGKDVASDDDIFNFLNRVYYELRNLGVAPQERALNFAATNAYQTQVAFAESAGRNLALDTIAVTKSPICRPDSDCWDVQLQMFDPENERRASRVYRYTVDVSEVLPVTVGTVRSWAVRTGAL